MLLSQHLRIWKTLKKYYTLYQLKISYFGMGSKFFTFLLQGQDAMTYIFNIFEILFQVCMKVEISLKEMAISKAFIMMSSKNLINAVSLKYHGFDLFLMVFSTRNIVFSAVQEPTRYFTC